MVLFITNSAFSSYNHKSENGNPVETSFRAAGIESYETNLKRLQKVNIWNRNHWILCEMLKTKDQGGDPKAQQTVMRPKNMNFWDAKDWSDFKKIYSEVPNRRACSLRSFRFYFHPARNFSCNKQKSPPCSFIDLLSK